MKQLGNADLSSSQENLSDLKKFVRELFRNLDSPKDLPRSSIPSSEMGMYSRAGLVLPVGYSVKNLLLTEWVCVCSACSVSLVCRSRFLSLLLNRACLTL